jgi:hypothetical protein
MARWLSIIVALTLFSAASSIQAQSDPKAATQPSIAVGARITMENWNQYRQYMSEGMIALFEGSHFWHLPKDVVIEVGPTISTPLPARYLDDTRKYSSQVHLTKLPAGGHFPERYVAGLPFANPLEGDPTLIGQRIFWNSYYRYQPRVQAAPGYSYTLDRAGNMTQTSELTSVFSQLAFLSDGNQQVVADAGPYYFAKYTEQVAPEQAKYTAVLDLTPKDPTQLDELYEYVPTLRRSLRLSQAARCAPLFGSDYVVDDENEGPPGLPQLYDVQYLGEKKILALEHAAREAFDSPGTSTQLEDKFYYRGSAGVIPFPKPSSGKWELRDSYVIALRRLPEFAKGYCYGKRVMYIDKENYFSGAQLDLYDPADSLFKSQFIFSYPAALPETQGDKVELVAGPNTSFLVNFKDQHLSIQPSLNSCVNSACAKSGYLDVHRYASPEGLMKIVQ